MVGPQMPVPLVRPAFHFVAHTFPAKRLRPIEAIERMAIKSIGLPGRFVPGAVLIADDRDGHDDALDAQLIRGGNAIIELAVRSHRELDRTRQLVVPQ
jgi:hypothetical protein